MSSYGSPLAAFHTPHWPILTHLSVSCTFVIRESDFHVSLCKSQLGWSGMAKDAGVLTEDVIIRVVTLNWTALEPAPEKRVRILKGSYPKPPVFRAHWLILLLPDCCSLHNQTLQDESSLQSSSFPLCLKPKQMCSFPLWPLEFCWTQETFWMNEQRAYYIR